MALVEGEPCAEVVGSCGYPEEIAALVGHFEVLLVQYEEEVWNRWSSELHELDRALVLIGAPPGTSAPGSKGTAFLSIEAAGDEITAAATAALRGLFVYDASALPSTFKETAIFEDPASMTSREVEILQLMADGLPNKQIAIRLRISIHTVKFHVAAILSKLGAASRTEAVTVGMRQGHIRL